MEQPIKSEYSDNLIAKGFRLLFLCCYEFNIINNINQQKNNKILIFSTFYSPCSNFTLKT